SSYHQQYQYRQSDPFADQRVRPWASLSTKTLRAPRASCPTLSPKLRAGSRAPEIFIVLETPVSSDNK
ncbi:MAG: hypothetical protein VXY25_04165, partial [Pseudomonadota bacterium]|nr:hypothetical protein [Pseudomonadota bacterium]